MSTENRCPHCNGDLMAPSAEPPRDLKEIHATEPPKPKPEPVITDAACDNCDCWLVEGWNYCPYCSTARNPEFPKPISDLSGLPESGRVFVYCKNGQGWQSTTAESARSNSWAYEAWAPMRPAPVPPQKSQDELDREAFDKWALGQCAMDSSFPAFKAGIAHARKQGEGK